MSDVIAEKGTPVVKDDRQPDGHMNAPLDPTGARQDALDAAKAGLAAQGNQQDGDMKGALDRLARTGDPLDRKYKELSEIKAASAKLGDFLDRTKPSEEELEALAKFIAEGTNAISAMNTLPEGGGDSLARLRTLVQTALAVRPYMESKSGVFSSKGEPPVDQSGQDGSPSESDQ